MALPTNTDLENFQKDTFAATVIVVWTTLIAFPFPFHFVQLRVNSALQDSVVLCSFSPEFSSTHSQNCAFSLHLCFSSSSLTYKVLYFFLPY